MIADEEFQATYWQVRSAILGRHFAIGGRSRANLISLDNTLRDQLPAAAGGLSAEAGALLQRWNVGYRMRENPLMWSGKLLAAIAAEHVLGSPQAERMAIAALDSIEALYRFHRMDHFDGYIIRWDGTSHLLIPGSRELSSSTPTRKTICTVSRTGTRVMSPSGRRRRWTGS